jgi:hypothetical protein
MITSRKVIKSSGSCPPIFAFSFAKIAARLAGEICFAASILKPENPKLNKDVK